jgi:hypothetical protein
MFLGKVETGHTGEGKARLERIEAVVGHVDGIDRALAYRAELWGEPHRLANEKICRAPSAWTFGERELFATFVSAQNQCPF